MVAVSDAVRQSQRFLDYPNIRRHFNRRQLAAIRLLPYGFEKCIFQPHRYAIGVASGHRFNFEDADVTEDGASIRLNNVTWVEPNFSLDEFGETQCICVRTADVVWFCESDGQASHFFHD